MAKKKGGIHWVHTLVIGSGAAGLNTAVQLAAQGVEDVLILSEGLKMGTSINTGSDKQTYYKLSMCGEDADSPRAMAETYFAGRRDARRPGAGRGQSVGARGFLNLVGLGVPFPMDAFGQAIGYKTDHDPRQRATSVWALHLARDVPGLDRRSEAARHSGARETQRGGAVDRGGRKRCAREPARSLSTPRADSRSMGPRTWCSRSRGPGGLYKTSVYPTVHTGAIGLAMLAGARCQSLPESQYGMASVRFRWNVSGTFMQVVPRASSAPMPTAGTSRNSCGPISAMRAR